MYSQFTQPDSLSGLLLWRRQGENRHLSERNDQGAEQSGSSVPHGLDRQETLLKCPNAIQIQDQRLMILNLYLVVLLTGITLLARISSKVRVLVLPAPDRVDGGAAQAAAELPCLLLRPPPARKLRRRTARAVDAARGHCRLGAEDGPAVLNPLGPPRRDPPVKAASMPHGVELYPFPRKPVNLDANPALMHAARGGPPPADALESRSGT